MNFHPNRILNVTSIPLKDFFIPSDNIETLLGGPATYADSFVNGTVILVEIFILIFYDRKDNH